MWYLLNFPRSQGRKWQNKGGSHRIQQVCRRQQRKPQLQWWQQRTPWIEVIRWGVERFDEEEAGPQSLKRRLSSFPPSPHRPLVEQTSQYDLGNSCHSNQIVSVMPGNAEFLTTAIHTEGCNCTKNCPLQQMIPQTNSHTLQSPN